MIPLGYGYQGQTNTLGISVDNISEYCTQYLSDYKQQKYYDLKDFYRRWKNRKYYNIY